MGNDLRWNKTKVFDPFPVCSDALKVKIRAVAEELDAHRKARQAEHPKLTLTQMYNVLEKLRAHADGRSGQGGRHSVPSPLVGEGQGGGDRRTSKVGVPPKGEGSQRSASGKR